jgi:hypothetical protein
MATAIGIVSGTLGLFISMIMIITIFNDKDKIDEEYGGASI